MANTPDTLPGTGVNTDNVGGVAWGSPGNTTAEDSTPASVQIAVIGAWSDFLDGKSFGFSIPAGSTIDGIRLRLRKATTGPGAEFYHDDSIRLLKAGTPHGDDKAAEDDWNWGATYKSSGERTGEPPISGAEHGRRRMSIMPSSVGPSLATVSAVRRGSLPTPTASASPSGSARAGPPWTHQAVHVLAAKARRHGVTGDRATAV